jgi:hypothetical protein
MPSKHFIDGRSSFVDGPCRPWPSRRRYCSGASKGGHYIGTDSTGGGPMPPLRCPAKAKAPRSLITASIRLVQRYARTRRRTRATVQKPFQRRGDGAPLNTSANGPIHAIDSLIEARQNWYQIQTPAVAGTTRSPRASTHWPAWMAEAVAVGEARQVCQQVPGRRPPQPLLASSTSTPAAPPPAPPHPRTPPPLWALRSGRQTPIAPFAPPSSLCALRHCNSRPRIHEPQRQ